MTILNRRKDVIVIVGAIAVYFAFRSINPVGLFLNYQRKQDHIEECMKVVKSANEQLKFLYSIFSIPEDKMEIMMNEIAKESCDCMIDSAGDNDINVYINNPDNNPALKKCSEEASKKAFAKYSPKDEDLKDSSTDPQEETDQQASPEEEVQ